MTERHREHEEHDRLHRIEHKVDALLCHMETLMAQNAEQTALLAEIAGFIADVSTDVDQLIALSQSGDPAALTAALTELRDKAKAASAKFPTVDPNAPVAPLRANQRR